MELEEKVTFLKGTAIFEDTPLEVLQKLAPMLQEARFKAGSKIIMKGEQGDSMYLIVEGEVKIHDGEHIYTNMKQGEGFGSFYLIDQIHRAATVTAHTETLLLQLFQEEFDELSKTESSFSRGMLRTLVRRLREMNRIEEQLAELNTTRDKFFSIIAHDLRGPLTTLVSLSEQLKNNRTIITEQEETEIIQDQYNVSSQSLKLLDNLLKWAQVQTGRLVPNPDLVNLSELMRELVSVSTPLAEAKKISLHVKTCGDLKVYTDVDMIRTVFVNLTNNAIKFTEEGGSVIVSCFKSSDKVQISVADTGVGIPEDRVASLFQIDKSISTDGTANEKGTGLGLILCKEFVEKNHGTIIVSSSPGAGSKFTVTLPLRNSE